MPFILGFCFLENLLFRACFRGSSRYGVGARRGCLMLIEIHELELRPVDFEEEIPPGVLDLGEELRQVETLYTSGRAQIVEERHGKHKIVRDIRLNGSLATRVELACARCLEPVVQKVAREFDLLYRPLGADAGREELSVTVAEAEVGYYQGENLLLEDVLREQVFLALPLKAICRDDCQGLCPHCGKNLNVEACNCAEPLEDPRRFAASWSADRNHTNRRASISRGIQWQIRNGDIQKRAPAPGARTTPSRVTLFPSALTVTSARCRTGPVPSADSTRAARSWKARKPASLHFPCQAS